MTSIMPFSCKTSVTQPKKLTEFKIAKTINQFYVIK